jgi:hypothetical protein
VHELFNKYDTKNPNDKQGKMLDDWSRNYKTIIVCNAGVDSDIEQLMSVFLRYEFPFVQFVEDEGLCNSRTGCGIILPVWLYDVNSIEPGSKYYDLIDIVKSKRLAC